MQRMAWDKSLPNLSPCPLFFPASGTPFRGHPKFYQGLNQIQSAPQVQHKHPL